ncbi:MAG: hypothetical protein ACO204_03130 [Schleiferiaceae bacterium]|jgi:hypothetical protein
MKKFLIIAVAALTTSCSTLFWTADVLIPSAKVVPTEGLNVQLFDAHGVRSTAQNVEIVARQFVDSTYFEKIVVPKFSEVFWQAKPTNYLWIASTTDTSIYELTYSKLTPVPIPTAVGVAVMAAGLATYSNDYGGTLLVGYLITNVGLIADVISASIYQGTVKRDTPKGIRREWKLRNVTPLAPDEVSPMVARGISAYVDSLRAEAE